MAQRVEQGGIDAWYALDAAELLGDEAALLPDLESIEAMITDALAAAA